MSIPMLPIIALALLGGLAVVFRGLRHPAYGLHVALVVGLSFLLASRVTDSVGIPALIGKSGMLHLVLINVSIYLLYLWDKRQAEQRGWRIPERTLHAFALAGGSIGALVAQQTIRHKNRKQSFKNTFYLILMAQLLLLGLAIGLSLQA